MKKLLLYFSIVFFTPQYCGAQNIIDFAGNGNVGYGGDGFPANSGVCELYQPAGICTDRTGNIYIADNANNVIRKVNTSGIISTFAGIRMPIYGGYSGDGGLATNAELNLPEDICADTSGNIFIADYDNGVIRMVNTSGIISTVVGSGYRGFSGDGGPATNAEMYLPVYVFVDNKDNIYISDLGNYRIRKVDASGVISTIAGNGIHGYSGDGGPATAAEFFDQGGVFTDSFDNVYVADASNQRVRMINYYTGIINTVGGCAAGGFSGDGGPATDAELNGPVDVFADKFNNLYISDYYNSRIREVTGLTTGMVSVSNGNLMVFPNPANNEISMQLKSTVEGLASLSIIDIAGRIIINSQFTVRNSQFTIDVSNLVSGMYFANISIDGQKYTQKFIKL